MPQLGHFKKKISITIDNHLNNKLNELATNKEWKYKFRSKSHMIEYFVQKGLTEAGVEE